MGQFVGLHNSKAKRWNIRPVNAQGRRTWDGFDGKIFFSILLSEKKPWQPNDIFKAKATRPVLLFGSSKGHNIPYVIGIKHLELVRPKPFFINDLTHILGPTW